MKIASRNVNGIRAVAGKGFYEWVKQNDPDIICLQEVKSFESQLPPAFRYHMANYNRIRHSGEKPGYSGVATFYKKSLSFISGISKFESVEHFHEEGRVVETKFQDFTLLNLYFPNGGERADGTEMLSYKLKFYEHFIHYINKLKDKGEKVITCGDFNICHREIDIARPKENANSIGFLPIERAEMDALEKNGYVDVFRYYNPELADQYTWWSYRANARHNNVGRRLDYFWVSQDVVSHIKKITHETSIEGSDHCPIVLELNF
ncbi:MAG: exodeoxyribonuclease III [candidate division SR1 bacterium]|nr:exodeoxyribonuclease III [candidate division SR1 bacterium]